MNRKIWTSLLLACGFAAFAGEEYKLVNDAENDISVNVSSGLLKIYCFDGIRPSLPLDAGAEIFSPRQMEGRAPKLSWKLESSKKQKAVLSTTLKENFAGIDLNGVDCRKTYVFDEKIPEVKITLEFRNNSDQKRYVYCGIRNEINLRPNAYEFTVIPAAIGTYPVADGMFLGFYSKPSAWCSTPVEAWAAKMNPALRQGLVFLPEWDLLGAFYATKGKVLGFTIDGGYLLPKTEVRFSYAIRPLKELEEVTTVNKSFAASLSPQAKNSVRVAIYPYENGELSGCIQVVDTERKTLLSRPVKMTLRKGKLHTMKIDQPVPTGHTAVLFSGEINGKAFSTEQYCENGFRMQSLPACGFAPHFLRPVPEKQHKTSADSAMPAKRKRHAVCFFGLYTNFNRFDKILKDWKIDTYSVNSPSMKNIPPASTLDEYSVMIIGNAFVFSLEVCMQRIRSFVRNGGILIVTGGPSAFGTGGYEKNPVLRELLPVESRPFDLQPAAGKGKFDQGVAIKGTGINPENAPCVYWLHRFMKLSPSAEILWRAGGEPLLVKGTFGKGRILCFLGAPLGDPKDGKNPYWESLEYENAMRAVIESVMEEMKR